MAEREPWRWASKRELGDDPDGEAFRTDVYDLSNEIEAEALRSTL